jgi:hypothetical protein
LLANWFLLIDIKHYKEAKKKLENKL